MPNPKHPQSQTTRLWLAIAAVLALGAASCGGDDASAGTIRLSSRDTDFAPDLDDTATSGKVEPALDVAYEDFDGGVHRLSDRSGKPMVVNFFAAWCTSCIAEMPDFETVYQELGDAVSFVGLSQDADPADGLGLVADTGVTYHVGWDPDLYVFSEFKGLALPTTVFIDSDGEVVEIFAGALDAEALRTKIAGILP